MIKLTKDDWTGIKIILGIIVADICICIFVKNVIVDPFKLRVQQLKQTQQQCRQVCGDHLVLCCDADQDILVCDPTTHVQHFPK